MKMYDFTGMALLEGARKEKMIDVPEVVEVVDFVTGELDNGNKWATLVASSSEELETLRSVGMADRAGVIKVSVKGYEGENLEKLVGKKLDTSDFSIDFDIKGKFRQIVGAKFICPNMKALKFVD